MSRNLEYKLAGSSFGPGDLEKVVANLLNEGWEPQGGVFVLTRAQEDRVPEGKDPGYYIYMQAMIREKD